MDATEPVGPLRERVDEALHGSLDGMWDEVLHEWDGASPSQRRAVRASVAGRRNQMVRALGDVEGQEALERALAIQYIEVKCHWMILNARIQHQTARTGTPDEVLIYRATCVSLILQSMEPLLSQECIDAIATFLAEPLL